MPYDMQVGLYLGIYWQLRFFELDRCDVVGYNAY